MIHLSAFEEDLKKIMIDAIIYKDEKSSCFCNEFLLIKILESEIKEDIFKSLYPKFNTKKIINDITEYSERNKEKLDTKEFYETLFDAKNQADKKSSSVITLDDYIVSLLNMKNGFSSNILKQNGISVDGFLGKLNFSQNSKIKEMEEKSIDENFIIDEKVSGFLNNINDVAKNNFFKVIGRDKEIEKSLNILNKKLKGNMILTGDSGVGKTSIIMGLAQKINEKDVPDNLKNKVILELNITKLLAGTKYRGDFEERINNVIEFAEKNENVIIYIDEIHTIVGSGLSSSSSNDAASLIKPALASGKIKCIGVTTYNDYKKTIAKDPSLKRRFEEVRVKEPNKEETFKIIKGIITDFEVHHQVNYTDDAIKTAIDLSVEYIKDRFLPDKAIDLIDEVGSKKSSNISEFKNIGKKEIQIYISDMYDVPLEKIQSKSNKIIKDLRKIIGKKVFGQDDAIELLHKKIVVSYAQLGTKDKPEGSFLFAGPTGVGKTEIVNQLSYYLNRNLIRLDMSEYMEKQSVSKLIGSPPGYIGHGETAMLTDAIIKNQDSIILVDEMEKAHQDIQNLFLQILDNAKLTDSQGNIVDFSKTMIIFTSNAGATEMEKRSIGFTEGGSIDVDKSDDEIERLFRPEFRNRLDAIVKFKPLQKDNLGYIVDKFMEPIVTKLKEEYNCKITLSKTAKDWLIENGYNIKMGARPMRRLIDDKIVFDLSLIMLSENIKNKEIKIVYNNKIDFIIKK